MKYYWIVPIYCVLNRQLTPGWTLIKNNLQSKRLRVGKFNCEGSADGKGNNLMMHFSHVHFILHRTL